MADAKPDPIRLLLIEDNEVDVVFVTRLLESNPELPFAVDHAPRQRCDLRI